MSSNTTPCSEFGPKALVGRTPFHGETGAADASAVRRWAARRRGYPCTRERRRRPQPKRRACRPRSKVFPSSRRSPREHSHAAVDPEHLAVDELCARPRQEGDRIGDFRRLGIADRATLSPNPSVSGSTTRVAWKRAVLVAPGLTALMRTPRSEAPWRGSACNGRRRPSAPRRSRRWCTPKCAAAEAILMTEPAPRLHHRRHERLADQHGADQVVLGQRP